MMTMLNSWKADVQTSIIELGQTFVVTLPDVVTVYPQMNTTLAFSLNAKVINYLTGMYTGLYWASDYSLQCERNAQNYNHFSI